MPPPRRRRGVRSRRRGFQRRYHRRPQFHPAATVGTLYEHDERTLFEKYGKMAAPYYRVEISDHADEILFETDAVLFNQAYDLEGVIIDQITIEEDIDGASQIELRVKNPDVNLQDSRIVAEGNNIDVWFGYDGHYPFYMGRGIVIEVKPEFESSQIPQLTIRGVDVSYFMMEDSKAEIQKEGSAWWERFTTTTPRRRARQNETPGDRVQISSANSSYPSTLSAEARAERVRLADLEQLVGGPDTPTIATEIDTEAVGRGEDLSAAGAPIVAVDTDPGRQEADRERRAIEIAWRRQRFSNRRRKAGHVWRGMTDADIVAAIYLAYGIVPYIEATDERRRRVTFANVAVDEGQVLGNTSSPNQSQLDADGEMQTRMDTNARLDPGAPRFEVVSGEERSRARSRELSNTGPTIDAVVAPAPDVEPERRRIVEEREVVQKAGTTDWDFIKGLAKNHGFILFVFFDLESNRWIGYWGPAEHVPQDVQFTFEYSRDVDSTIESITPTLSLRGQSTEIDLIYVDPRNRRENRLRIAVENLSDYSPEFRGPDGPMPITEPVGRGPEVTLLIHGQRVVTHANRPFTSAEEARQWLMAYWLRHANDFLLIEGKTIIGIPELRGREFHRFAGIGRMEGEYFVTTSTHRMSTGQLYTTEFGGRKVLGAGWRASDDAESEMLSVDSTELGTPFPDMEGITYPLGRLMSNPFG